MSCPSINLVLVALQSIRSPGAHHRFANQAAHLASSSQTQGYCDDSFYMSVWLGQSIKSQARCWRVGILYIGLTSIFSWLYQGKGFLWSCKRASSNQLKGLKMENWDFPGEVEILPQEWAAVWRLPPCGPALQILDLPAPTTR